MKCSTCSRESVYFRINEGRYYCKLCFLKNIEKKVKRTIGNNKLINPDDKIAVALSGGKDSTNTLFILNKLFNKNPTIEFFALTIDEGIKGYRDQTIKNAKTLCKSLGIDHYVVSFKKEFGFTLDDLIKKKGVENSCSYCGVLRRYLLNKIARELKATKLATGHNLDDEAQSMIMNILKGDVIRLLRCGAKPILLTHEKFVTRIKPLVGIPETESALYNSFTRGSSKNLKCPYAVSNVLRGYTRDFLNRLEKSSPGIKFSLVTNMYKLISNIKKTVIIKEDIEICKKCGEPTSQNTCKACSLIESI